MAFTSRNAQRNTLFVSTGMIVVLLTLFGAVGGNFSNPAVPGDLARYLEGRGSKKDAESGQYVIQRVADGTRHGQRLRKLKFGGEPVLKTDVTGDSPYAECREEACSKLEKADRRCFERRSQGGKKGRHFSIRNAFRSNAHQKRLCGAKTCGRGCQCPDASFHLTGQAFDINDWKDCEDILWEEGFIGGCEGMQFDDPGHFSIGEFGVKKEWYSKIWHFTKKWTCEGLK